MDPPKVQESQEQKHLGCYEGYREDINPADSIPHQRPCIVTILAQEMSNVWITTNCYDDIGCTSGVLYIVIRSFGLFKRFIIHRENSVDPIDFPSSPYHSLNNLNTPEKRVPRSHVLSHHPDPISEIDE